LFAECDDAALASAARLLSCLQVEAGEVLMREHQPGGDLLLVGMAVVVTRDDAVARDRPLDVVVSGVIGEFAALEDTRRSATVTALEAGEIYVCDHGDVAALLALPGVRRSVAELAAHRRMVNRAAALYPVETRLRDGTSIDLRPILPYDRVGLEASTDRLSPRTRYLRFFSAYTPPPEALARLADVDYPEHFAWVALAPDEPGAPIIGSGRFFRLAEAPDTAELALTVVDEYQRRGLGTALCDALAVTATEAGYRRFAAVVLSENIPVRGLLAHAGAKLSYDASPQTMSTVFDIPSEPLAPNLDRAAVRAAARHVLGERAGSSA
jgi:RimJ/RimL family protein N-acetyltransferase